MDMIIREYTRDDVEGAAMIWNHIVEEGIALPQTDCLIKESADAFLLEQSFTGIAFDRRSGVTVGLYTLHPNDVGRCGHICSANYAVKWDMRGWQIGEKLVCHCMEKGRELSFGTPRSSAAVKTNEAVLHLYQKLGLTRLDIIPRGFLVKDGRCEDTIPHYTVL